MCLLPKQKSLLPEVGFDGSLPMNGAVYRLDCTSDTELNPYTVKKENFCVYDEDSMEVEVKEALYNPLEKKVILVLEPEMVYNSYMVYASDAVKDVSGNSAASESEICINTAYEVGIDGLGVSDLAFFGRNGRIFNPEGKMALAVRIRIQNQTPDMQNRKLKVYLEDSEENPLVLSDVKLNAASTGEFVFRLSEKEYPCDATVKIDLQ